MLQKALAHFNTDKHQWYGWKDIADGEVYSNLKLNDETAVMPSEEEVNAIAEEGRHHACLAWEPRLEADPVGYVCALSDPDGNLVEFSYGQSITQLKLKPTSY